jgi:hypothetical protein
VIATSKRPFSSFRIFLYRCAWLICFLTPVSVPPASAQVIRVDANQSHVTNTIRPTEAVGAGIDRLPYGATDKLFVESTIKQVLTSGWQTITYRQNTELHMEAWHWNPQGTWSDSAGKGYFTRTAIRCLIAASHATMAQTRKAIRELRTATPTPIGRATPISPRNLRERATRCIRNG